MYRQSDKDEESVLCAYVFVAGNIDVYVHIYVYKYTCDCVCYMHLPIFG